MESIINHLAQSLGIGQQWAWFICGALSMLILNKILSSLKSKGENTTVGSLPVTKRTISSAASSTTINLNMGGTTQTTFSPEVSAELQNLLRNGDKISAIKLIREHTGQGLAEAKMLAEALEKALH